MHRDSDTTYVGFVLVVLAVLALVLSVNLTIKLDTLGTCLSDHPTNAAYCGTLKDAARPDAGTK